MKISIIVPCYNQSEYMDECLQSALDQAYQNWECIIVNDGSPDNTEEVARKWMEKDERFRYLKKENGGLSSARNAGINAARGEWILPLDCDDKIATDYLREAALYFEKDYKVISCNAYFFGELNVDWHFPEFDYKQLLLRNNLHCASFFRKEDWQKAGGFDERMKLGFEDWEFWIRLLMNHQNSFYRMEKNLFYYRKKKASMLQDLKTKESEVENYIFEKHKTLYLDTFGSYIKILNNLHHSNLKYQKVVNSKRMIFFNKVLDILKW